MEVPGDVFELNLDVTCEQLFLRQEDGKGLSGIGNGRSRSMAVWKSIAMFVYKMGNQVGRVGGS